jgi:hypothetical protein
MSFEAYDPNGPSTRSADPLLSIYTDGNSRLNVAAIDRWFDGVERVRVLIDPENARLAFDREAGSERATLSVSQRGNGGGDIHTTGALKNFGYDEAAHEETAHHELHKHEETGYIVADISGLPGFDSGDAGDHDPAPEPEPDPDPDPEPKSESKSESAPNSTEQEPETDDLEGDGDTKEDLDDQEDESDDTSGTLDDDLPPEDEDILLSTAAEHCGRLGQSMVDRLANAGFETLGDIRAATDAELKSVHYVGPSTVETIRDCVDAYDPADVDETPATIDISEHDRTPPEGMDEGSIYAVAQHFDTLDAVAKDLEVSVERAAAILAAHKQDLLIQVDIGDREVIDE